MLLLFDGEQGAINTLRFVEEKIGVGLWSLDIETDRMEWSALIQDRSSLRCLCSAA